MKSFHDRKKNNVLPWKSGTSGDFMQIYKNPCFRPSPRSATPFIKVRFYLLHEDKIFEQPTLPVVKHGKRKNGMKILFKIFFLF